MWEFDVRKPLCFYQQWELCRLDGRSTWSRLVFYVFSVSSYFALSPHFLLCFSIISFPSWSSLLLPFLVITPSASSNWPGIHPSHSFPDVPFFALWCILNFMRHSFFVFIDPSILVASRSKFCANTVISSLAVYFQSFHWQNKGKMHLDTVHLL